jgi:hypothetical protein
MDPSTFDTLARAIAQTGTRRGLVRLVASLPVVGILAVVAEQESGAERPVDRVQGRTPQRNRKQRNNKKNKNNNNKNNQKKNQNTNQNRTATPVGCQPDGGACTQPNECCGSNCFNLRCAPPVRQCGPTKCVGHTIGCCNDVCCSAPEDRCTAEHQCCAPSCAGKQCGPDGCGGTCGSCGVCQTCTAQGTCQQAPDGTICGTSTHGGTTLRCCKGACPDPNCIPSVVPQFGCATCGVNGSNCCTPQTGTVCQDDVCQCSGAIKGQVCGSDRDCQAGGSTATECICGICCDGTDCSF